jgi:hypothetical protein
VFPLVAVSHVTLNDMPMPATTDEIKCDLNCQKHAAVIDARHASRLVGQQRLDNAPLGVCQVVSAHSDAESGFHPMGRPPACDRAWLAVVTLTPHTHYDSNMSREEGNADITLRPDEGAAIVHFWSRLTTGSAHPAGKHQVDTLILAVVTRRHGTWRIQAAENVTLTNPRTGVPTLRS